MATFGGVSALPLVVAVRRGLVTAHGLDLTVGRTTDSVTMGDDLLAGRVDVAHAAPDNVFGWADGVSDGANGTGPSSVAAWLAGSNGPIALVARTASRIVDLRGARIGVDSPTSGFAPILMRMLDAASVDSADVELVALGATRGRAQALIEGRIDASMLTLPWSTLAVGAGGHLLADHTSVTHGLLTSAAIARRRWLADEPETAARYRSMLAQAVAWLRDPASRTAAATWLAEDVGVEPTIAREVLSSMAHPVTGWPRDVALDARSLDMAHELRTSLGRPPRRVASDYLVAA